MLHIFCLCIFALLQLTKLNATNLCAIQITALLRSNEKKKQKKNADPMGAMAGAINFHFCYAQSL